MFSPVAQAALRLVRKRAWRSTAIGSKWCLVAAPQRSGVSAFDARLFSSKTGDKSEGKGENDGSERPFDTSQIHPGEWDVDYKDPLYRPKFRSNAKVISAEDFANRPMVGFEEEYTSYEDAMITLSWMTDRVSKQIYNAYCDMMTMSQEKHGMTSHDYVVKVLATKFQITPDHAAAIVQLQHDEAQIAKENPEDLLDYEANHAEQQILFNIREAYRSERLTPPANYLEEAIGRHGHGENDEISFRFQKSDDVFDIDQMLENALVREADRARAIIDNHKYVVDVDEQLVDTHVDKSCKKLLREHKRFQRFAKLNYGVENKDDEENSGDANVPSPPTLEAPEAPEAPGPSKDKPSSDSISEEEEEEGAQNGSNSEDAGAFIASTEKLRRRKKGKTGKKKGKKALKIKNPYDGTIPYPEVNSNGEKRRSWKFVAKIVDTRELRLRNKAPTYKNQSMENTLVEENGMLRVATVDECRHVEWRENYKGSEFIFREARKAWVNQTVHGEKNAWGRAPSTPSGNYGPTGPNSKLPQDFVSSLEELDEMAGRAVDDIPLSELTAVRRWKERKAMKNTAAAAADESEEKEDGDDDDEEKDEVSNGATEIEVEAEEDAETADDADHGNDNQSK